MNWFQRYGIPGAYFVLLLATLLMAMSWLDARNLLVSAGAGIGAIAAVALLPAGYMLCILSMLWYYHFPYDCLVPWRFHKRAWGWVWRHKYADEPTPKSGEREIEAAATVVARWQCSTLGSGALERSSFVQERCVKRTDVLAMNSSMILGAVIAWLVGFVLLALRWLISLPLDVHGWWVLSWFILSGVAGGVMWAANVTLGKQAVHVVRHHLAGLDEHGQLRECLAGMDPPRRSGTRAR